MLSVDLVLERLLVDTSRRFAASGIPHRALKGPVVARTAYPSPAQRSFGDVDILVAGATVRRGDRAPRRGGRAARATANRGRTSRRVSARACASSRPTDSRSTSTARSSPVRSVSRSTRRDLFAGRRDDRHRRRRDPGAERGGPVPPRVLPHRARPARASPRCATSRRSRPLTDLDVDATLDLAGAGAGRAVVQRAAGAHAHPAAGRARRPALRVGRALPARSVRDDGAAARTRPKAAATRARWRPASGRCAACAPASRTAPRCSCPTAATSREREGSYVRRWVRASSSCDRLEALRERDVFRALDFAFTVTATDPALQDVVDHAYDACRSAGDGDDAVHAPRTRHRRDERSSCSRTTHG